MSSLVVDDIYVTQTLPFLKGLTELLHQMVCLEKAATGANAILDLDGFLAVYAHVFAATEALASLLPEPTRQETMMPPAEASA